MNSVTPSSAADPSDGLTPALLATHLRLFAWCLNPTLLGRIRAQETHRDAITDLLTHTDHLMIEMRRRAKGALPAKLIPNMAGTHVPDLPRRASTLAAQFEVLEHVLDSLAHGLPVSRACVEHYYAVIMACFHLEEMLTELLAAKEVTGAVLEPASK